MNYSQLAWLIPLFPFAAFLVLTAAGRTMPRSAPVIGVAAMIPSFVLAVLVLFEQFGGTAAYTYAEWDWLKLEGYTLTMGFEINGLNALMLVIVTLVSLLVNLYSAGYMQGDDRIGVFYSYVALFTSAMLGLVIAENLLQLYIFWELVGLGSFLLIGFWYYKPEAKAAARKAFIMTRIGDVGLFLAILLLFWHMPNHALDFTSIHNAFANGQAPFGEGLVTLVALLIFVGAVGKSGQLPLHTWLPDAMEGPTPISALIHAATMVAAGVYLVARTFDIFTASPDAMLTVAWVGGMTALFAATIGVAQNDIKRVLAYSTVSQLGYMMMALGVGAYTAGVFHLFTHAFFKALLFLGAGSVIHAVHTQNINEMGGLGRKMKITAWTFGIGALALSGIPPFAGFWSKDAILSAAFHDHPALFAIGLIGAFLTAFYMARLFLLVFAGKSHADNHAHTEESPWVMTLPMAVLAVLSVAAGFVELPGSGQLGEWLGRPAAHHDSGALVMILSTGVALAGLLLGWAIYGKGFVSRDLVSSRAPWLHQLLYRKYYVDELYGAVIVKPIKALADLLRLFDHYVVDGLVRLSASAFYGIGRLGHRVQNGQVQTYGLVTLIGLLIFMLALAGRRLLDVG
ncbi:NADH-quinone oxidoreductase subunit L [Paenibacillus thermoaerophilus]|uniref:NADH-quinone oxidoreductase subunit L n=1 Tax=Paenibacillus thermoaerophilus TaxID=1215385 RepID=A0ABW2V7G6_9BACL|nr:NADH-quinone oxidoreductase subunit L [Paenibacillus thermoaerophilus]TMV12493.1 NADH-quinone oxidoreductase subunit L [Paenibacillus thermoaerophilus]